jgi:hypothetical protein
MRSQFGSFCGLDNRKTVMELFRKLGDHYPEQLAMQKRAAFLKSLLVKSDNGFSGAPMVVDACSAVEAYLLFVAITSSLGVPIEEAAKSLEAFVRAQ